MHANQASRGAFQDTRFFIVGMNIIKHEAGKHICPMQSEAPSTERKWTLLALH